MISVDKTYYRFRAERGHAVILLWDAVLCGSARDSRPLPDTRVLCKDIREVTCLACLGHAAFQDAEDAGDTDLPYGGTA